MGKRVRRFHDAVAKRVVRVCTPSHKLSKEERNKLKGIKDLRSLPGCVVAYDELGHIIAAGKITKDGELVKRKTRLPHDMKWIQVGWDERDGVRVPVLEPAKKTMYNVLATVRRVERKFEHPIDRYLRHKGVIR